MKLSKPQLDRVSTLLGAVAGVCTVLVTQDVGHPKLIGTVGGIATVGLGIITQRPADKAPTTEDIEEEVLKE